MKDLTVSINGMEIPVLAAANLPSVKRWIYSMINRKIFVHPEESPIDWIKPDGEAMFDKEQAGFVDCQINCCYHLLSTSDGDHDICQIAMEYGQTIRKKGNPTGQDVFRDRISTRSNP